MLLTTLEPSRGAFPENRPTHPNDLIMLIKHYIAAAALACTSAVCQSAPYPEFAITQVSDEGRLLLITATKLDPNSVVQLQYSAPKSGVACCQRLKASQFKPSKAEVVTGNELTDGEGFVYEARVPSHWFRDPFIGMAAVGAFKHARSQDDLLEGTAMDNKPVRAALCTSSEGVHLQATRGHQVQTHLYLWLGYDIADPTCKLAPKTK